MKEVENSIWKYYMCSKLWENLQTFGDILKCWFPSKLISKLLIVFPLDIALELMTFLPCSLLQYWGQQYVQMSLGAGSMVLVMLNWYLKWKKREKTDTTASAEARFMKQLAILKFLKFLTNRDKRLKLNTIL